MKKPGVRNIKSDWRVPRVAEYGILQAAAVRYAKKGFAVVPMHTVFNGSCSCYKGKECNSPGKHPAISDGVKGASSKVSRVRKWWKANPARSIGIATGTPSGVVVIDVDPRNGGDETMKVMTEQLGSCGSMVRSDTGGAGVHHIFKMPNFSIRKDSNGKIFGRGLDVLSDGAIFIAPPSRHASGNKYKWQPGASLLSKPLGALPKKWRDHIRSRQVADGSSPEALERIEAGRRNTALTSMAGRLQNTGLSAAALLAALSEENAVRCSPPLAKNEVAKIAKSIAKTSINRGRGAKQEDLAERVVNVLLDSEFGGGDHLLHCSDGRFWVFNGRHWEIIQEAWLRGRILSALKSLPERGSMATSSIIGQVVILLKAGQSSGGDPLRFMSSPIPVINCSNGELWINEDGTVELRNHAAKSYLRHCLDVEYRAEAKCPLYDKAIHEIFARAQPSSKGMSRHWNELFGYIIQSERRIPIITVLKGGGSNGKTVLMNTVIQLIGRGLVSAQSIESLEKQFAMGNLLGKLLLLDDDVKSGIRLPDGQLKKISEAKMVTGEYKHGPQFNFTVRALPVLLCNNVPSLGDVTFGMRRRLMVIPFDRTFTERRKDADLFERIWKTEMSGVLNRAIEGLQRLIERGMRFRYPAAVNAAKAAWLIQANPLPAFIDECCERDAKASCLLAKLYTEYTNWAVVKGFTRVQQAATLRQNLQNLEFTIKKRNKGQTVLGLGLK